MMFDLKLVQIIKYAGYKIILQNKNLGFIKIPRDDHFKNDVITRFKEFVEKKYISDAESICRYSLGSFFYFLK